MLRVMLQVEWSIIGYGEKNIKSLLHNFWIFLAIPFFAACGREESVKIGMAVPMSGLLAEHGKDIAKGAQMAVDELNARPFKVDGKRIHFELVQEDDKASPDEGKAAAKRLVDAKVVAVLGHLNSGVSIAAAPIYAQAGIPQMAISTNPRYTRLGFGTAFRLVADDVKQGESLGRLISEELSTKSVFLVDDQTTFGRGLADEVMKALKRKGMRPSYESIDPKKVDYAQLVLKIKGARSDTVFFGGDETTGIPLFKALQKANVQARFVTGDAMCAPATLKSMQGIRIENFFCTVAGVPPSWLSVGIGFAKTFQEKYGQPPGAFSAMAYDGINVLAEAMQRAKSVDPQKYLSVLKKGSFSGKIAGSIEFDERGDTKYGTVVVYESINGQLKERLPRGTSSSASNAAVIIGSKLDTESTLLCALVKFALEAKGIKANDKCSIGSTQVVRKALLDGEIDLYPEYTGNAPYLIKDVVFKPGVFKNAEKGYAAGAKADLAKNNIIWLKPAPANNTYTITLPKKLMEEEKVTSMADLAKYINSGKKLKLAASKEFINGEYGLKAFERSYGFKLTPEQLIIMPGNNTTQTESAAAHGTGGANAAMGYGTDGQIYAMDLVALSDPKHAVDIYQPVITVRGETLNRYPAIKSAIEPIFVTLDTQTLSRLNAQIVIGGQSAPAVAEQYLKQKGFIN